MWLKWYCISGHVRQYLVTLAFLWEKLSKPQFYKDLTTKTNSSEGCPWFKLNNLRLALGMALKFYISVAEGLKPKKVRNFLGLIPTFVEVTRGKLVRAFFAPSPILINRVKNSLPNWQCNGKNNLYVIVLSAQLECEVSL